MIQSKMKLAVPAPLETFEVELEDRARVKIRRHGNRNGARVMVSQNNGFANDAYLPLSR